MFEEIDYEELAQEAGMLADNWSEGGAFGDDDEEIVIFEEGGYTTGILSGDVFDALDAGEAGAVRGFRGRPRRVRMRRRNQGIKGNDPRSRKVRALAGTVAKNSKALARLAKQIKTFGVQINSGAPEVATPGSPGGMRPVFGGTLQQGAPGGVGMSGWGPLQIQPAGGAYASYLILEVYEDTYPAVAAGNTLIPGLAVFDIANLTVAGANILRSNGLNTPGGMFGVGGGNYGYPLAAGRDVKIDGGSAINVLGRINPRAPGGASGFTVTGAFLSPGMARA